METIMNLTVAEIFGGIAGIVIVLSVFIEITPIKINPVSSFLAWLGKKINRELMDKFDTLDNKVNNLEDKIETMQSEEGERDAINCRIRILQFGDEVRHGTRHSEESFDQVLTDIDNYERYCSEHPEFKNNRTVLTKEKILEVYAECIDKGDFL